MIKQCPTMSMQESRQRNRFFPTDNAYSYFVDALAQQVMKDLKDQCGYTDTQAYNAVYSGGLSIYSTQNQSLQKICDEEANDDANYPSKSNMVSIMR